MEILLVETGFYYWEVYKLWPYLVNNFQVKLSMKAERVLQEAMKVAKHGDAFYFWAQLPNDDNFEDRKGIHEDFWSFCDMVNNNNCRHVTIRNLSFVCFWKKVICEVRNWNFLAGLYSWMLSRECMDCLKAGYLCLPCQLVVVNGQVFILGLCPHLLTRNL